MKRLFVLVFSIGCGFLMAQNVPDPIIIDKTKSYKKKTIFLQDVAEVEYIVLETNENCLINDEMWVESIRLTSRDIFISVKGEIFRFSRKGKYLNRIGRVGGGPGEYENLGAMVIDEDREQVILYEQGKGKLFFYDLNGNYIKDLATPEIHGFELFDDNQLACYATLLHDISPFTIRSIDDGQIKKELSSPYFSRSGIHYYLSTRSTNARKYKEEVFFNSFVSDTIFSVNKNRVLTPRYIILPPNGGKTTPECDKCTTPFLFVETETYAYIMLRGKEIGTSSAETYYIIDKKNGDIFSGYLADKEASRPIILENSGLDNQIVGLFYQNNLEERLEDGRLSGKLKEVTENLPEESNPVLVIATMK